MFYEYSENESANTENHTILILMCYFVALAAGEIFSPLLFREVETDVIKENQPLQNKGIYVFLKDNVLIG